MLDTERGSRAAAQPSSEVDRILDELDRAVAGEPWHGDALMKLVDGIEARTAAARPVPAAHTIWEIVLHLTVWHRVVARRLRGEAIYPSPAEDWPAVHDTSPAAWSRALEALAESYATLRRAVEEIDDRRLAETAPGRPTSIYVHLHGVAQHDAYHGGQIALLKKAQGLDALPRAAIARTWRGATRAEDAEAYLRYLHETGLRGFRETPGNVGALTLRRIAGDRAEFLVVSFWDSEAAIRRFAGDDAERAVFYPEDDRFLVERDDRVEHFEVVYRTDAARVG